MVESPSPPAVLLPVASMAARAGTARDDQAAQPIERRRRPDRILGSPSGERAVTRIQPRRAGHIVTVTLPARAYKPMAAYRNEAKAMNAREQPTA